MGAIAGTARSYRGLAMRRSAPWARSRHGPLLQGVIIAATNSAYVKTRIGTMAQRQ